MEADPVQICTWEDLMATAAASDDLTFRSAKCEATEDSSGCGKTGMRKAGSEKEEQEWSGDGSSKTGSEEDGSTKEGEGNKVPPDALDRKYETGLFEKLAAPRRSSLGDITFNASHGGADKLRNALPDSGSPRAVHRSASSSASQESVVTESAVASSHVCNLDDLAQAPTLALIGNSVSMTSIVRRITRLEEDVANLQLLMEPAKSNEKLTEMVHAEVELLAGKAIADFRTEMQETVSQTLDACVKKDSELMWDSHGGSGDKDNNQSQIRDSFYQIDTDVVARLNLAEQMLQQQCLWTQSRNTEVTKEIHGMKKALLESSTQWTVQRALVTEIHGKLQAVLKILPSLDNSVPEVKESVDLNVFALSDPSPVYQPSPFPPSSMPEAVVVPTTLSPSMPEMLLSPSMPETVVVQTAGPPTVDVNVETLGPSPAYIPLDQPVQTVAGNFTMETTYAQACSVSPSSQIRSVAPNLAMGGVQQHSDSLIRTIPGHTPMITPQLGQSSPRASALYQRVVAPRSLIRSPRSGSVPPPRAHSPPAIAAMTTSSRARASSEVPIRGRWKDRELHLPMCLTTNAAVGSHVAQAPYPLPMGQALQEPVVTHPPQYFNMKQDWTPPPVAVRRSRHSSPVLRSVKAQGSQQLLTEPTSPVVSPGLMPPPGLTTPGDIEISSPPLMRCARFGKLNKGAPPPRVPNIGELQALVRDVQTWTKRSSSPGPQPSVQGHSEEAKVGCF
eukprot:gnl/MRDRNA2_/MRDRNA2_79810_c0_seq1.p1 gnl/MRDRNA2_/MRDRNA2_79810_c0~~gnl/MRDRNA2_/MRDRNA2_79810_c0_seq1.p1  ORF type:complete len:806 (-),score=150.06 gnl/MRDRNA2_/MRDRNA2_79810_c0_seq1:84-2273(-)